MRHKMAISAFALGFTLCFTQQSTNGTSPSEAEQFRSTVLNYMAADPDFEPGDLISRSQIEELQQYLRRSRGPSLETQVRWSKRALPDNAPLVQLFMKDGAPVLRSAEKQLGGYAAIDRLTRLSAGRKTIATAIAEQTPNTIIAAVEEPTQMQPSNKTPQIQRIYTAEEFVAAIEKERKKKKTLAHKTEENQPNSQEGSK